MGLDFHDPGFLAALAFGLASPAILARWLLTGGRKRW